MIAQPVTGRGTWADLVAAHAATLSPAPQRLSLVEAAALPLAGLTAAQALDRIPLAHRRLLVVGAAGGVGRLAVQLAKRAGATVDGLVTRPEHLDVEGPTW